MYEEDKKAIANTIIMLIDENDALTGFSPKGDAIQIQNKILLVIASLILKGLSDDN